MPCFAAVCQTLGHRTQRCPGLAAAVVVLLWALLLGTAAPPTRAQGVEVLELSAQRDEPSIRVDYQLRVTLSPAVEDALLRGVPIYFRTQATLWRPRWYWRDERIARTAREWRLSFQPLTSSWRISQGGLGQSFATLAEALVAMSRNSDWKIADARDIEPDARPYVEFSWRQDTAQLPPPMQIGLGGIGGTSEWSLGVERTLRLGPDVHK